MNYTHLSIDEREVILKIKENSKNLEQIAEKLGRDKSTISTVRIHSGIRRYKRCRDQATFFL